MAMQAVKKLRDELGLPEETIPVAAFVRMISDELEQLRDECRSDGSICDLIKQASGIEIDSVDLKRFYATAEQRHPPSRPS